MILGLSSFAFGWSIGVPTQTSNDKMSELNLIETAAKLNLSCLQFGDNMPLHQLSQDQLNRLKESALQHKLRIEVGARKLTEDHLNTYLQITRFFESPLLRFVIDGDDYKPSLDEVYILLKKMAPVFAEHQITLGIENHDRFKAIELANLMRKINNDFIGICLDTVNSMGAGEGIEYVVNLLAPYTVNLHIKDFIVQRYWHNMGFTINGVPAGTGQMQLPWIIDRLEPFKKCQSAVLEQWIPWEENQSALIEKEYSWAEQSIQYLKSLHLFTPV
ncbi:MAG: TIM barrel protein [Saprospiraceae bacterium]